MKQSAAACLIVWALGLPSAPDAAAGHCTALPIEVVTADHSEAADACATAARVFEFLAAQGLQQAAPLRLDLLDALPAVCSPESIGCYEPRERRIHLLSQARCEDQLSRSLRWLNPAEFCRSSLAHEYAHAIADSNFRPGRRTLLAHEYIAYVTMFAVMPDALRRRVLADFDDDGFEGPEQMSVDYYALDPMAFGLKAYLHFLKPQGGRAFIEALLSGDVILH